MPQDAFTLYHIADALNTALSGGKINKIVQPTAEETVFSVYANRENIKLVLSANARFCRASIENNDEKSPANALNFCSLLRKHLLGATFESCSLVEFERIIAFTIKGKNEFFEDTTFVLYAEIMGKYSNLILTSGGKILGAIKQSFADINAKRLLFSGADYSLPPKQDKISPFDRDAVRSLLNGFQGGAPDAYLFNNIQGLAPLTATEIIYSFFRDEEVKSFSENFFDYFYKFLFDKKNDANVLSLNKPIDFFPCRYTHLTGNYTPFQNVLLAQQSYYTRACSTDAVESKRKFLLDKVKAATKKIEKKLAVVLEKELTEKKLEDNRIKGELLTAYQHSLKIGLKSCELVNYYDENGGTIKIALDEKLSPNENAQKYFKLYLKQKKTLKAIEPQKIEHLSNLDYCRTVYEELVSAETLDDFVLIERELVAEGLLKKQSETKKPVLQPLKRVFEFLGYRIKVGKNNIENDVLTFSSEKNDVWLHVKGFHSAHTVISAKNASIPDEVLLVAAEICAYYSQAKESNKVEVDYTLIKFVKKPAGFKAGAVTYTNQKSIAVCPNSHDELLKKPD